MTFIVCGGRDYEDTMAVHNALDALHRKRGITRIIQGGCRGADEAAEDWCKRNAIECVTVNADWGKHGNAAGPLRNREMLAMNPDGVVAFPGGAGTADMVKAARKAGLTVWEPLKGKKEHRWRERD